MKILGLAFALLSIAGCSTQPDSLRLAKRDAELVEFAKYSPTWPSGTLALALNFEGNAPFAAIANEQRQAQFRCHVLDATGTPVTDTGIGWVFFEGPATPAGQVSLLVPGELSSEGERYRYKAILYPGLKAFTEVNQPADFNLLKRDYDRIRCQLVGVQMIGGFMYSNELSVSRSELIRLHERNATKSQMPDWH
ncbi:hypothetical protein ACQ859_21105 [Roseateles chitinivorans]|uniref:hypothetical protein n=1 Tax=Roseateles chitinivorans TaxID=2917965 RepID=UPI003D678BAF